MIPKSKRLFVVAVGLCVLCFSAAMACAQNLPPQYPGMAPEPGHQQHDEIDKQMEKTRLKKANQERQEQIKLDTDKLLQLSTELKQYVDKTNENILSLDVIKKADEIERLAHAIKEKMKEE